MVSQRLKAAMATTFVNAVASRRPLFAGGRGTRRVARLFSPDFSFIFAPCGTMNQKSSLVKTLNLSHGRSRGTPFRIWGGLAGNDEVVAPIGGGPTPLSALEATS